VLKIEGLCKQEGTFSLGPLDMALEPGIHVLLGPNGSGKSTLLALLAGISKPASGRIFYANQDLGRLPPRERAHIVARVPQQLPDGIGFTVGEFVAMGRYHHDPWGYMKTDRAAIRKHLDTVDLLEREHQSCLSLSGGEMRRACLAQALCQDTPILLLDEPGSFLDYRHVRALVDSLKAVATDPSRIIILVTHDMGLAANLAEYVFLLKAGRIIANGPVDMLYEPGLLDGVFGVRFRIDRDKTRIDIDFSTPTDAS
jgi:iron complex transport system ATP-binding protein